MYPFFRAKKVFCSNKEKSNIVLFRIPNTLLILLNLYRGVPLRHIKIMSIQMVSKMDFNKQTVKLVF